MGGLGFLPLGSFFLSSFMLFAMDACTTLGRPGCFSVSEKHRGKIEKKEVGGEQCFVHLLQSGQRKKYSRIAEGPTA